MLVPKLCLGTFMGSSRFPSGRVLPAGDEERKEDMKQELHVL